MLHFCNLISVIHVAHFDRFGIHPDHVLTDGMVVDDVGDAAAHSGSKVLACITEDDHTSAGHILQTVVADAFNDDFRPAVPHAETFTGFAVYEHLTACGTVQADVADDDFMTAAGVRCSHGDPSAGQAFPDIIVQIAGMMECQAFGYEGAVTLPAVAGRIHGIAVVRESAAAEPGSDFTAEPCSYVPVPVCHLVCRFK